MSKATAVTLALARLVVLGLGVLITYYAFKAYRRTRTRYMRDASIGFGIITTGVLIEGVLFEVLSLHLAVVHIVESVAIGIGFLILLSSLRR